MQFETYIYFKTYTKRRWKSYFWKRYGYYGGKREGWSREWVKREFCWIFRIPEVENRLGGRREDKHEKKRTKNKMAENRPGSGVWAADWRSNRTCIRCSVIYLVVCKVKEVRTLQEIPRLMDDHEFRKELERIQEHLNAISKGSNTVEVRRNYLISCVTVPSAKIYTPDQLRQIFDLTWK